MKRLRFFFAVSWLGGLLESLALAFFLFWLAYLTQAMVNSEVLTRLSAPIMVSIYTAIRIRLPTSVQRADFVAEARTAALLWVSLCLAKALCQFLLRVGGVPPLNASNTFIDLFIFGISAATYPGWRFLGWLWGKWEQMRRKKFIWSIMQVFVLTVLGILFLAISLASALFFLPQTHGWSDSSLTANGHAIQNVIQWMIGVVVLTPVVMVPALILLLPPVIFAAYRITRRFSRRLDRLEEAAHRLSQGDFSERLPIEGEDEIARLQEDFNRMAGQLETSNQALIGERDRVAGVLAAQQRLTASISHDLRTPISIALVALDNALDRQAEQTCEQHARDLETARHEILHLQALIEDLFTVSKAALNHLNLRMAATDLEPILQNAVAALRPIAWAAGRVRVSAEIPEPLPQVEADATRVEQVLINLLNNGIRHTPPGGFVLVTAETGPEFTRVAVIDSGVGIAAQALPHIWEPFYMVDGILSAGHSGLGLAIVKELISSMGGEISVASEPGQGSTFTFSLKVSQQLENPATNLRQS